MEHDLNIPYNVLLAIAPNIPVLLMTAFVLQGHICFYFKHKLTSTSYLCLHLKYLDLRMFAPENKTKTLRKIIFF